MDWSVVFEPSTSVIEMMIRGAVIYLGVFIMMRIAGRRESGELNTTDLILVVLISEAASVGIGGEAHSIIDSLVVIGTIIVLNTALDAASYRWTWAARILKPKPRPLIVDGVLNRATARSEMLTRSEIDSQLRKAGVESVAQVRQAYVEPDGTISIISRTP